MYQKSRPKANKTVPRNSKTLGRKPAPNGAEVLKSQDYKCGVCGTALNPVTRREDCCFDIVPGTAEARGALCSRCAKGLSCLRFDKDLLKKAIAYLVMVESKE